MHISVGRLRLEPGTNRLRLLWHGALAYLQARRADGVIHASVYREDGRTLWSLGLWRGDAGLSKFREPSPGPAGGAGTWGAGRLSSLAGRCRPELGGREAPF